MKTQIKDEDLELLKALAVLKKYHEKEDSGQKIFDQDIWTLIDALIKTTTQTHTCPRCSTALKLYINLN
ncbi:hypothetical protein HN615_08420 [Candidatus Woesearchaeota archaeon]|jgi:hypothetical protein|nr:hypothetical protein [Candidatus Woesearchaeota archaeon]